MIRRNHRHAHLPDPKLVVDSVRPGVPMLFPGESMKLAPF
jgi:hypothetical protein